MLGSGFHTSYSLGGTRLAEALPDIQFSFEACGSVDRFSDLSDKIKETNLTLRVSVPETPSPTNHFWRERCV